MRRGRLRPLAFAFLRTGPAWNDGVEVPANTPRFPSNSGIRGLMNEEDTTNYVLNSDWANHTNTTIGTSSILKAAVTLFGRSRNGILWTQGPTDDGVGASLAVGTVPTTSGQVFTLSMDVNATVANFGKATVRATVGGVGYWLNTAGTAWQTTSAEFDIFATYTTPGVDKRVAVTLPALPTGTLTLLSVTGFAHKVADFTAKLADVQIEVGSVATSLIPTSGAIATRAAETTTVPTAGLLAPSQGSVTIRAYVDAFLLGTSSGVRALFRVCDSNAANEVALWITSTAVAAETTNASVQNTTLLPNKSGLSVGWHTFVVRWSAAELSVWLNGVKLSSSASPKIPATFAAAVAGSLHIGCDPIQAGRQPNQPIAWIATHTRALSDAEIAASVLAPAPDFTAYLDFTTGRMRAYRPLSAIARLRRIGALR